MNVIRHRYFFLAFSSVLVAASMAALSVWGLRLGIDFTGGTLMEVEFSDGLPPIDAIRGALESLGLGSLALQPAGERGVILRFQHIDEATHQKILSELSGISAAPPPFEERRFATIGPTIGAELYRRSLMALALAIAAIVAYIAWAFRRISEPVASWKYGVAAIAALVHDIAIPAGTFAALGRLRGVEIDALFIIALLTVLGFSVHDTIVVFDRIRENLRASGRREAYAETVGRSIDETLARSLFTSLTVLMVLAAVFFFGGSATQHLALALIIGIIAGTYSSICVASPLLILWHDLTKEK